MSEKNKRWEEMRLGKRDMSITDIVQGLEACATVKCEKCPLDGHVDGWFQEDLPDCTKVLLENAAKRFRRERKWRWDDIFKVYRCPTCGRPEKPATEVSTNGEVKHSLPSRCTYCREELDGVEGEENDH